MIDEAAAHEDISQMSFGDLAKFAWVGMPCDLSTRCKKKRAAVTRRELRRRPTAIDRPLASPSQRESERPAEGRETEAERQRPRDRGTPKLKKDTLTPLPPCTVEAAFGPLVPQARRLALSEIICGATTCPRGRRQTHPRCNDARRRREAIGEDGRQGRPARIGPRDRTP